jgi:hypothetical protein
MSEDEARKSMNEDDEVEAHRHKVAAADEAADEARKGARGEEDEVEAHAFKKNRPAKGI